MTKKKNTIKREMAKIVRQKIPSASLESVDPSDAEKGDVTILHAIAMAQVKKSLEGDLKAAEFIEKLLSSEDEGMHIDNFGVVVKVVGGEDGA